MVHCFLPQEKIACTTAFCWLNGSTRYSIFKRNSPTLIVDLQPRQFANRFCLLCKITNYSLLYLLADCKILWHSGVLSWTSGSLNNIGMLVVALEITDLRSSSPIHVFDRRCSSLSCRIKKKFKYNMLA